MRHDEAPAPFRARRCDPVAYPPRRPVRPITLCVVNAPNTDRQSDTSNGPAPASVEFLVEGMHCGSCVALIEETLQEQAGVSSATVDLDSARAVVGFDPSQIDVDALTAAVAEAGYAATLAG